MNKEDLLYLLPTQRVKAFDGLAITAEVWELAHEYTRQQIRFHQLLSHGPGVLTGLSVIASIPPDTSVYILPGVAVDNWGRMIILQKPLTFDVGETAEGLIYLLLHYAESQPKAERGRGEEGAPLFIHDEFKVSALPALPETPFVELARLVRESRNAPIRNAADEQQPRINEIDLRFRNTADFPVPEVVRVAMGYLGGLTQEQHGEGIEYVARAMNRHQDYRVIVDFGLPLDSPDLEQYHLVYLAAGGEFDLTRIELNSLYSFITKGGTLLFESCQRQPNGNTSAAATAFHDMLASLGLRLGNLPADSSLLRQPYLFSQPPRGFEPEGTILVGEGVIYSTYDYGGSWQGQQREGKPSREAIRTAFEWGENLMTQAISRKEEIENKDKPNVTSLTAQLLELVEQPD